MKDKTLRQRVIQAAYESPGPVRDALLPLLKQASLGPEALEQLVTTEINSLVRRDPGLAEGGAPKRGESTAKAEVAALSFERYLEAVLPVYVRKIGLSDPDALMDGLEDTAVAWRVFVAFHQKDFSVLPMGWGKLVKRGELPQEFSLKPQKELAKILSKDTKLQGLYSKVAGAIKDAALDQITDYGLLHRSKTALSSVAETILDQMGGRRRLSAMLGVSGRPPYYFQDIPHGVQFMWPNKQRSKGNMLRVTLRPDDTYDMEFLSASARGTKTVKRFSMIYADQLVELFEKQTGWYLRM